MKFRILFAVSLLCCGTAIASPRLKEFLGAPRQAVGTFNSVATQPAPATAPADVKSASILLDTVSQKIWHELTKPLPKDATTIQRDQYERAKEEVITNCVQSIPGMTGRISFRVVDIVTRPTPEEPKQPSLKTEQAVIEYQQMLSRYRNDLASLGQLPLVAIGELPLKDDSPEMLRIKADMQSVANRFKTQNDALQQRLRNAKSDSSRDSIRGELHRLIDRRNKTMADLRQKLREVSGSNDFVYVFGTTARFASWRRDQTRSVVGFVDRIRVEARMEKNNPIVDFDAVVWLLSEPTLESDDSAVPATQSVN